MPPVPSLRHLARRRDGTEMGVLNLDPTTCMRLGIAPVNDTETVWLLPRCGPRGVVGLRPDCLVYL